MDKTTKRNNFIAVLAVYFAANVIFIMSPAINVMQTELFPNEPYTSILLISTISSLCMIPGSLVAGAILGKIKYKTMALISMGGIIIFLSLIHILVLTNCGGKADSAETMAFSMVPAFLSGSFTAM